MLEEDCAFSKGEKQIDLTNSTLTASPVTGTLFQAHINQKMDPSTG